MVLSFERFINHYIFYIYMTEDSLEATIQVLEEGQGANKIKNHLPYSFKFDGTTLSYSRAEFKQNPEGYIDQQLIAFQTYLEEVRAYHSDDQRQYDKDNEFYEKRESTDSRIEEISQKLSPDQSISFKKFMSKTLNFIYSVAYRLRRTNPESFYRGRIETSQKRERLYTLLMEVNEAGKVFFEWLLRTREANGIPNDYREKLQECARISGEISVEYSGIITIAQRHAELHQKFYHMLSTQR